MTYQPTPPPATTSVPPPEPIDDSPQHPMRRAVLWFARAITWLLYAYIIIVEIILLLGFLLLLGGANPSSSFVQWAYRNLDRAMRPFRGIFEPIELGTTSGDVPAVVETSVLFAMIVYGILLLAVSALMQWLKGRVAKLDREDAEYVRQQNADRRLAAMQQQAAAAQPTTAPPAQPLPAAPAQPAPGGPAQPAPAAPAQPAPGGPAQPPAPPTPSQPSTTPQPPPTS